MQVRDELLAGIPRRQSEDGTDAGSVRDPQSAVKVAEITAQVAQWMKKTRDAMDLGEEWRGAGGGRRPPPALRVGYSLGCGGLISSQDTVPWRRTFRLNTLSPAVTKRMSRAGPPKTRFEISALSGLFQMATTRPGWSQI